MPRHRSDLPAEVSDLLRRGTAIPAHPLALDASRRLDPVRQRVLIDMMFNMGPGAPSRGGLLSFVNTLSEIRRGNYGIAADMMLASKWASQVGRRAVRLATMMRTGMDYTE